MKEVQVTQIMTETQLECLRKLQIGTVIEVKELETAPKPSKRKDRIQKMSEKLERKLNRAS